MPPPFRVCTMIHVCQQIQTSTCFMLHASSWIRWCQIWASFCVCVIPYSGVVTSLPHCNIFSAAALTLFRLLMQREFVLVKRNSFLYIFRFFLTMFMAVTTATLFLRTQLHPNSLSQGQLYFGVVFFSLIMLMFDGFAEMTFTILRLPGFYKQRGGPILLLLSAVSAVSAVHHPSLSSSGETVVPGLHLDRPYQVLMYHIQ